MRVHCTELILEVTVNFQHYNILWMFFVYHVNDILFLHIVLNTDDSRYLKHWYLKLLHLPEVLEHLHLLIILVLKFGIVYNYFIPFWATVKTISPSVLWTTWRTIAQDRRPRAIVHQAVYSTEGLIPYLPYVFGQTGLSKQYRPRWDAAERGVFCGVSSGTSLFATLPANFRHNIG